MKNWVFEKVATMAWAGLVCLGYFSFFIGKTPFIQAAGLLTGAILSSIAITLAIQKIKEIDE